MSGVGRGQSLTALLRARREARARQQQGNDSNNESNENSSNNVKNGSSSNFKSGRETTKTGLVEGRGGRDSDTGLGSSLVTASTSDKDNKAVRQSPLCADPIKDEAWALPQDRGHSGQKIDLEVNYVRLRRLKPGVGYHEYYVSFEPDLEDRRDRFKALFLCKQAMFHGQSHSFDGTIFALPFKLQQDVTESRVVLTRNNSEKRVKVIFTYQKSCSFGDPEAVAQYNRIFKQIMRTLKMVQMNNNYYNPNKAKHISKMKLEIWPGLVTHVQENQGGLMLQCDVSHRVLREDTVFDIIKDVMASKMSNARNRDGISSEKDAKKEISRALLGLSVLTRYNNKVYRIDDIDFNETPLSTFITGQGETLSYVDYYKRTYEINIADLQQPMLVSLPRKMDAEQKNRAAHLVPELCHMTGLTEEQRNDHKNMRDILAIMRTGPQERSEAVKKFVEAVKETQEANQLLAGWGLELEDCAIRLEGRVLNPVSLVFGPQNTKLKIGKDFGDKLREHSLMLPVSVDNWLLIYTEHIQKSASAFKQIFVQVSRNLGMQITRPDEICLRRATAADYVRAIESKMVNKDCQMRPKFVCTIMASQREDIYKAVKQTCYLNHGVANQCLLAKNVEHRNVRSIMENVAMQINVKIGGKLWGVYTPYENAMIVGIDVYHNPSKELDQHDRRSYLGFVASLDRYMTKFSSQSIRQLPHQEMGETLTDAYVKALSAYIKENGRAPDRIIVFRDGVGDSRLDLLRDLEVGQIKRATTIVLNQNNLATKSGDVLATDSLVPVTLMVVSKRISTRLLSVVREHNKGNPPPGTVLDHTITRQKWLDFYLVSQSVKQGTVSPTHFIVVEDGCSMGAEKAQRLSYMLTYGYANWTGSVRVPAPVLLAHRLAKMVGETLKASPEAQSDLLYYL